MLLFILQEPREIADEGTAGLPELRLEPCPRQGDLRFVALKQWTKLGDWEAAVHGAQELVCHGWIVAPFAHQQIEKGSTFLQNIAHSPPHVLPEIVLPSTQPSQVLLLLADSVAMVSFFAKQPLLRVTLRDAVDDLLDGILNFVAGPRVGDQLR